MPSTDDVVTLRAGALELVLVPAGGGSIARFGLVRDGADYLPIMRPAPTPPGGDPLLYGSFPLVPFSNRIRDGLLVVGDKTFGLPANFVQSRHTIHGDGWQQPWTVTAASATAATLRYATDGTRTWWPFAYASEQHFELTANTLVHRIDLVNTDRRSFPAGIGHHPYFLRAGARLTATMPTIWYSEDEIPVRQAPIPPDLDCRTGETVPLDNCFAGWDGKAVIDWPEQGLSVTLTADPIFGHTVVYVPPGQDYFCFEPVSNLTDGMRLRREGMGGTGIVDLAPGERLTGTVTYRVSQTFEVR
jgi:aldose 1-epimerase